MGCEQCPRKCGADRENGELGFCAQGSEAQIAKISLHPFEEPPISGKNGSGAIFFCGCPLRCIFCQNVKISRGEVEGKKYSPAELCEAMLELQAQGAANINLVSSSHFTSAVIPALREAKPFLRIPVVYNSSGYESVDTLHRLNGLIDVYMPDFKYASSAIAKEYSSAPDYPQVALEAIREMYRQVGSCEYAEDGTLRRGLIIRHLVLPACRSDSAEVLRLLSQTVPVRDVLLSLMSQYTPDFASPDAPKNLRRRVTTFEYESVVRVALELGFDGFIQRKESADKRFTPDF